MSFSYDIKNELAHKEPVKKCCRLAEIAGFIRLNGAIKLAGGGKFSVVMKTENPAIARHFKTMIKSYFGVVARLENSSSPFNKNTKIHELIITPDMNADQILRETGILIVREGMNDINDGIDENLIKTKCCRKAYLRGLFLAKGTISNPIKGYHLEIDASTETLSQDIRRLINSFVGINAKVVKRKSVYVVYIKDAEQIKDILNILGAHMKLLEFENVRVTKEVKNMANRQSNCDNANLDKTIEAGGRQIDAINSVGLENLPELLREIAEVRLKHPESSLGDLCEMFDPPIKKATLHYRMKKIEKMAHDL